MILIFNTNNTQEAIEDFDKNVAPKITQGHPYLTLYLDRIKPFLYRGSFQLYSHLLLTGSALSASQGSEFDSDIISLINKFIEHKKPILGICHGHQMLARALAGDDSCRRTKVPEFSWRKINIKDNPLFAGIENPILMESHYDEVCNLNDDFEIIASNDDCRIQGFQYKNNPFWGVQFHPEVNLEIGDKMIDNHIKNNPQDKKYYKNELQNPEQIEQNFKIFSNFFRQKGAQ